MTKQKKVHTLQLTPTPHFVHYLFQSSPPSFVRSTFEQIRNSKCENGGVIKFGSDFRPAHYDSDIGEFDCIRTPSLIDIEVLPEIESEMDGAHIV